MRVENRKRVMRGISISDNTHIRRFSDSIYLVVDVVRFSTTAAVLCSKFPQVDITQPSKTLINEWKRHNKHGIVFAELRGRKLDCAQHDNSPFQALNEEFTNCPVLLASTNGAKLALKLAGDRTYTVAFVNISKTMKILERELRKKRKKVYIVPASNGIKDHYCCSIIKKLMESSYKSISNFTDKTTIYRILRCNSQRSEEDLQICASLDMFNFAVKICERPDGNFAMAKRVYTCVE